MGSYRFRTATLAGSFLLASPIVALAQAGPDPATACSAISGLTLAQAKVVSAQTVAPGAFVLAGVSDGDDAGLYKSLPAFCRVVVTAEPSPDSNIRLEVWLPASGWNGRFRGQGNGGFAGEIAYSSLGLSVSQGYASAGTDTGHTGGSTDAGWALGHPEKIIDFGYRGVHIMTDIAKTIIDAYYGKAPVHSYFASCSDGGREALMEAQRFPADYDGILAGAPAYSWTNLVASGVHKMLALLATTESYIPASKAPAIAEAVRAACDAQDGVRDGILNDPRQCHFKPEALLCKPAQSETSDACLSAAQVHTLDVLYGAAIDAHGREVYPRSLPGGEEGPNGWATWVLGAEPGKSLGYAFGTGYFSNFVYEDPTWDFKTFDLDKDLKKALSKTGGALNATDPDLKPFSSRGGKLILYHGWNDPAISPLSTIAYYQQVQHANSDAASFVRLFMVPGMQHCAGGPGPSSFGQFGWRPGTGPDDVQHNIYRALEQWVEQHDAPDEVIAARIESKDNAAPAITMTRPLCAYPKQAKYKGAGDTADTKNFVCVAGAK